MTEEPQDDELAYKQKFEVIVKMIGEAAPSLCRGLYPIDVMGAFVAVGVQLGRRTLPTATVAAYLRQLANDLDEKTHTESDRLN